MTLRGRSLDRNRRARGSDRAPAPGAGSWYAGRVPLGPLLLIPVLLSPAPFLGTVGQGASLSAAATASGRPSECSSGSKRALAKGPSIWELARVPTLQRYCDLMARAHAELPTMPEAARKAAQEADQALPGHAA